MGRTNRRPVGGWTAQRRRHPFQEVARWLLGVRHQQGIRLRRVKGGLPRASTGGGREPLLAGPPPSPVEPPPHPTHQE